MRGPRPAINSVAERVGVEGLQAVAWRLAPNHVAIVCVDTSLARSPGHCAGAVECMLWCWHHWRDRR